ncbi:CRE-TTR-8 protein [Aphelenchoides avenae]|nr:CRE-TTR-8 protein [Aphelenchus avenae]
MQKLLLSLTVAVLVLAIAEGKKQTVGVRGNLICGDKAAPPGTEIKLLQKKTAGSDEILAEGVTEANGYFQLQGTGSATFGTIDPVVKIYHSCNSDENCKRKYKKHIGSEFVAEGQAVKQWHDIGNFDLAPKQLDEDDKCH